ncbi:dCMP deaminase [Actinoplanes sp. RD1]|uniref:dCMP deaminase n=1 Tax=Actinoplanes sp. RD1 TaxID=3064538 RepID=UPI002740352D|nr:dCMP deaminase [Actinoplanes sp. RD1]
MTLRSDRDLLQAAVDLSRLSPPAPTHYAVGAVVADAAGGILATGYTGEAEHFHAEEAALAKLAGPAVTLYTSLEPCTFRRSRPRPCTDLILAAGIRRVVLALREPLLFADCHGVESLRAAGVEVVELPELAPAVRKINAHLLAAPAL